MSLATFRGVDLAGNPLTVKPPRYVKGRFMPQNISMLPARITKKSDDQWQATALAYVRWLAARDNIALPTTGVIRASWSGVYKTRKTGRPVYERRIQSVIWGHKEEVYNTRKDGRRGAWLYTSFVTDFEFPLPNWDWQPEMTEEQDSPMLMAA